MKNIHYIKTASLRETTKVLDTMGFKECAYTDRFDGIKTGAIVRMEEKTYELVGYVSPGTTYTSMEDLIAILTPPVTLEQAISAHKAGGVVEMIIGIDSVNFLGPDTELQALIHPNATFKIRPKKTLTQILNGLSTVPHALENGENPPDLPMKEILDAAIGELIRLNALAEKRVP